MKKKILITGAEGFLGKHLQNFLSKKNFVIYCLQKKKIKNKNLSNVKYFKCDIRNKNRLKEIISLTKPHYIFHLAAKSHPSFSFKKPIETLITNAIGTANLLNSIVELKFDPKIVIACSSAQYGTRVFDELPLKEDDGFVPDHIYGLSKYFQGVLGKQYLKMYNLKIVNAIIFNTSGPGKKNDIFFDLSKQYLRQKNYKKINIVCGNLRNQRDFLHYEDTVNALYILAKKGISGENYNISTGKLIKINQLINYIKLKSKKIIKIIQVKNKFRKFDEKYISGDSRKLNKIGWKAKKNYKHILDEMCFDILN
jgi:GDP-4-dehydro-6-deoxy-D-mannose reductase